VLAFLQWKQPVAARTAYLRVSIDAVVGSTHPQVALALPYKGRPLPC